MSIHGHRVPGRIGGQRSSHDSALGKVLHDALTSARNATASVLVLTARGIETAAERIAGHSRVVDDIMRYFRTGEIPEQARAAVPSELRYVDSELIAYGDRFLKIDHVDRHPNFLLPRVEEAHVTLRVLDDPKRADDKVLSPDGEEVPYAVGEVTFAFTSALPFRTNLSDFVAFLASAPTAPAPARTVSFTS